MFVEIGDLRRHVFVEIEGRTAASGKIEWRTTTAAWVSQPISPAPSLPLGSEGRVFVSGVGCCSFSLASFVALFPRANEACVTVDVTQRQLPVRAGVAGKTSGVACFSFFQGK